RASERLTEKNGIGVARLKLGDEPFPKAKRFGVRIIHAEDANAALAPEDHYVEQGLPERLPIGALEIERINILILFGRVLGVLDRAVGSMAEPFGMFAHQGMIGRTLKSDVIASSRPCSRAACNRCSKSGSVPNSG